MLLTSSVIVSQKVLYVDCLWVCLTALLEPLWKVWNEYLLTLNEIINRFTPEEASKQEFCEGKYLLMLCFIGSVICRSYLIAISIL